MTWERHAGECFSAWEETRAGQFAVQQQQHLLLHLMTDWRRRQQRLLEVGCGTGRFLETFWHAGFDVTGVDASAELIAKARRRLGYRADFQVGRADYLDIEDRSFDYVVIRMLAGFCPEPQRLLREAGRVARKGVMIGLFNCKSLYAASVRLSRDGGEAGEMLKRARVRGWPDLRRCIRKCLSVDSLRAASVLPGPACTWRNGGLSRSLNSKLYPPKWGAYCAGRVDLARDRIGTPLMAWKAEPSASCFSSQLLRRKPNSLRDGLRM